MLQKSRSCNIRSLKGYTSSTTSPFQHKSRAAHNCGKTVSLCSKKKCWRNVHLYRATLSKDSRTTLCAFSSWTSRGQVFAGTPLTTTHLYSHWGKWCVQRKFRAGLCLTLQPLHQPPCQIHSSTSSWWIWRTDRQTETNGTNTGYSGFSEVSQLQFATFNVRILVSQMTYDNLLV